MLRNYEDCIRKAGYLIQKYEQLEEHTEELLQIYERTIREYEESEEIFQKKENTWNEMMQLHLDEEELLQKKLRSCVDYMKESLGGAFFFRKETISNINHPDGNTLKMSHKRGMMESSPDKGTVFIFNNLHRREGDDVQTTEREKEDRAGIVGNQKNGRGTL